MKKSFKLKEENKKVERTLEAIKHEVKSYLKRETRKKLPEESGRWEFDCKFGTNGEEPKVVHVSEIKECIEKASTDACEEVYIEILSKPGKRKNPIQEKVK